MEPAIQSRKAFTRREGIDRSQQLRRAWQLGFLGWNVFVGALFYLWVRQFEVPNSDLALQRPAGVEGYLPIAGLMNLKYWLASGHVPAIHPAAMFLFLAFCGTALLLRKAFCSWLCPVGTLSEYLWRTGEYFLGRNWRLPRWLDIPIRGLKYLVLAFFAWAVYTMPASAIDEFMRTPYGLIVDVKMLSFFRNLTETAALILLLLVAASVVVKHFWCRYLCPYGALLGLLSWFSPTRIRRDEQSCIECGKCAKACPSLLPVDKLITIRNAECTGCLECTTACPSEGALSVTLGAGRVKRSLPPWAIAAGLTALCLGTMVGAKLSGHWESAITNIQYQQVIEHAEEAAHPIP